MKKNRVLGVLVGALTVTVVLATVAFAALNENCTVSILNRTAQVQPDGTFVVPNVPYTKLQAN
ncbi:MAG: hypothetical protein OEY97_04060 [Nitrospirota bacterium]|nr:hypothetical protein [Nitrospirota bacterium]